MAGNVAAARKVIGTLGEAGGHSVGSLQNAYSWLCDGLGGKNREKTGKYVCETEKEHMGLGQTKRRWTFYSASDHIFTSQE